MTPYIHVKQLHRLTEDSVEAVVSAAPCTPHAHVLARWCMFVTPLLFASAKEQCQQDRNILVQWLFVCPDCFKQHINNSGNLVLSHSGYPLL